MARRRAKPTNGRWTPASGQSTRARTEASICSKMAEAGGGCSGWTRQPPDRPSVGRVRDSAEVGLHGLPAVRIFLPGRLVADRRRDDDMLTGLPVDGGGDTLV